MVILLLTFGTAIAMGIPILTAIMSLLGPSGWWLPKRIKRATLKFSIEGNEWFAEHETPANALPEEPEEHHEPDRNE